MSFGKSLRPHYFGCPKCRRCCYTGEVSEDVGIGIGLRSIPYDNTH